MINRNELDGETVAAEEGGYEKIYEALERIMKSFHEGCDGRYYAELDKNDYQAIAELLAHEELLCWQNFVAELRAKASRPRRGRRAR